jgi:hypothetical protein
VNGLLTRLLSAKNLLEGIWLMATPGAAFVAELSKQADKQLAELQKRLKETQQIHRFLGSLSGALDAGHPSEAVKILASHKNQLALLTRIDPDAASRIESLGSELRAQAEEIFQELPRGFSLAVQNEGLLLDPGSRHPRYSLLDEFIEVRFDKGKLEATVVPRDGRKTVLGVDPDVVAKHVSAEVARLTARPFEPKAFLAKLADAYQAVLKESALAGGENVPLKRLVAELAKDKNFRADEFNVDLSKFLRDKEAAGRVALDNARDARNGMLLWQLDQRGYYGYIRVEG